MKHDCGMTIHNHIFCTVPLLMFYLVANNGQQMATDLRGRYHQYLTGDEGDGLDQIPPEHALAMLIHCELRLSCFHFNNF